MIDCLSGKAAEKYGTFSLNGADLQKTHLLLKFCHM